ncbi:28240_t:CDS:2, partial [Racocetra persica]
MVNSPLPTDLASECRKAAKILNSFIDPVAAKGPDKVIPPNILQKAKGFAIFTVIKAGFVFSGRVGSGLVVARLEDGSWSAPSAIMTGGMGFGGQLGAELTDFVIVLNSRAAVKSFMHGGNVTLGGNLIDNIIVAAGPIGRNAEGAGSVSLGHVAAVFSY